MAFSFGYLLDLRPLFSIGCGSIGSSQEGKRFIWFVWLLFAELSGKQGILFALKGRE
jgi:hypothetical protein